jgi:hypothetical protein
MVSLQLNAREPAVLVLSSRHKDLKCIASRPYEARSAILKYEKTPIKGVDRGKGSSIEKQVLSSRGQSHYDHYVCEKSPERFVTYNVSFYI